MKVSHIEHLGIAVKSLDEAIPYWENVIGLKCYAIEEVPDQKVRTAFFMLGQTKIELLEPTSEESTIAKFIENRGIGIHHMTQIPYHRQPLLLPRIHTPDPHRQTSQHPGTQYP